LAVLHQRHRCVYNGRQLGRSGVTSTALHGKENSVQHPIDLSKTFNYVDLGR
jgi:hypothetical protein